LLIVAKKYEEAIDMCYKQHIILTEEMAEKMTLAKSDGGDDEYRNALLEKIGDCCAAQVRLDPPYDYPLASKGHQFRLCIVCRRTMRLPPRSTPSLALVSRP
jgi:hypothetical protein